MVMKNTQPSSVSAAARTPRMGAIQFLNYFFVTVFLVSSIAFFLGAIAAATADSSYSSYDEDVLMGASMMVGGVLGALLSGIGWAICVLSFRLAVKGVI